MTQTMKQMEAKRRFDELRSEIEVLEIENPGLTVQVFEKPSRVAASSVTRPLRRAVLTRLVLRARSGEIWVDKSGGTWHGTAPWSDDSMRAGVDGLPRDAAAAVVFAESDV